MARASLLPPMFGSLTQRMRRPGDTVSPQLERAQQLRRQGDAAAALEVYGSILAARPRLAAALLGAAGVHEDAGDFPKALAQLDQLLSFEPRNADAIAAKERIAEQSGDGAAAIALWSALIERFPDDVGYRVRRELVRLRVGDERIALRELVRLAQADPASGEIAEQTARAARWLERGDEALHWFRIAASRLPDRPDLALEVARELLRLQRFEEAEATIDALQSPPVDRQALAQLKHEIGARRDPEAIEPTAAEDIPAAEPAPSPTQQALTFAEEGNLDEAMRTLDRELQRNAAFPIARWRARVAHAFGDFGGAIAAIGPQVDDAAPVALADARLAVRARLDAERIDEAWAELRRHEAQFAPRDLAEERADLLRADLRLDEELALLQERVQADPLDETFASRLADALLDRGEVDAAGRIIDAWSRRRPAARVWAHKRLQRSWARHRDWRGLVADSQQILDGAPPRLQVHLEMDHIRVLRKSGDFEAAVQRLDEFARRLPGLPLARRERLALECEIAHELTWLGRHADARPRFDRLLQESMSRRMRDELYRLCCANESYGGGDLQRFAGLRNAISNPRHHLEITPFEPVGGAAPPQRVLVLLHLFHGDLWPEIRERLARLDRGALRFAVGIGEPVTDAVVAQVREFAPQAQIVRVENRGFDVGGHWQVLDHVDLRDFDLALVLQTKKSGHTRVGKVWRDQLVDALVGSPERWQDNLRRFAGRPQLGLVGSAWHQSSFHPWSYPAMRDVLAALGMPLGFNALQPTHRFVTGTMLLIRASLLAEMHAKMRLPFERVEDLSLARLGDSSRAHAMERAFGMYAAWRGYEACWRP